MSRKTFRAGGYLDGGGEKYVKKPRARGPRPDRRILERDRKTIYRKRADRPRSYGSRG